MTFQYMERVLVLNGSKTIGASVRRFFDKVYVTKTISSGRGSIKKLNFNPSTDIVEIAKKIQDYDEIWAAGGDGHLNQLFYNLKGFKGRIGILPIGTGNDFAKNTGSDSIEQAVKLLSNREMSTTKPIHLMELELPEFRFKTLFHTVSDVSFGARLTVMVNNQPFFKKILGKNAYNVAAVLSYINHKNVKIEANVNGTLETYRKVCVIAAMNGMYTGGGLLLSEDGSPHKKHFDMTLGHGLMPSIFGWSQILPLLLQMDKGDKNLFNNPIIRPYTKLTEMQITSDKGLGRYLNTDGEIYKTNKPIKKIVYRVSVVSYNLIVPVEL